jgi:hypothetical protein
MLEILLKYPGSLVELRGTEDELAFAANVYQIKCEEVIVKTKKEKVLVGLICRADDLLAAMEEIEMSSMDSTDLFNLPEEF